MSARSGAKEKKSEVLYQRLGQRWYAFSVVNGEVFFAEVPADTIDGSPKAGEAGETNHVPPATFTPDHKSSKTGKA